MDLSELKSRLNIKQQKFAEEYIQTGNATKAAIKAGYSKKTAATNSTKLLKNTNVAEYIEGMREEMMNDTILTGQEVLYRLSQIATAQVTERDFVINKRAEYIKNENNPEKMQLVYNENVVAIEKPPKISDQNKALELLGKHHKLFTDVQDINAQVTPIFEDDIL
ncbi:terminase small subunit [Staphylococcus lugdunensis]|uniref:terminase small subunit n=1 Tax=Staphylococcus lugdunensis TaxID=28035 RepID=UPI00226427F8|nr:terminase small subunit [Staphylococcus lugdunensis]UZW83595.1 terminase small subunit [Staphylococcus lugdunensis]